MKISGMLSVVALVMSGWITSYAQAIESEVPGDHFSLEGALELFKKSESPEEFEKLLNSADSRVNNLDLNGDGYIDYIRVLDRYEGNVHAFILQAVIGESEYQDVAVIELEKLSNGKAVLQIVGNEDIYGVETIIEPTREVRTYAGTRSSNTIVNVWAWPSVQYVYGPHYAGWISPWGWHARPVWWHTWRPVAYVYYHPIWRPYRPYYSVCHTRRVVYAHQIYRPYRTRSVVVHNRYHDKITRYRSERNDDRYGNRADRNDGRRLNERDRRSSVANTSGRSRENSEVSRRAESDRRPVTSPNRSNTRDRDLSTDIQRNSSESNRRSANENNNRETRPQVTRPTAADRSRSESDNARERESHRPRSVPSDIQGSSWSAKREDFSNRRSSVPNNAEIRQQTRRPSTVERSRPTQTQNVQRPTTRERHAPSNIQRGSTAPSRNSVSAPSHRSTPQPSPGPSVNRSRSSPGPAVQQRSSGRTDGSGSREMKRGRQ